MVLLPLENPVALKTGTTIPTPLASDNSTGVINSAWVRSLIGSDLQGYSTYLANIAGFSGPSGGFVKKAAAGGISLVSTVLVSEISNFASEVLVAVGAAVKEPTGFKDITKSALTFDNGTRTLTISPVGDPNFTVFVQGVTYVKTAQSFQISATEGPHFVYFDASGVLAEVLAFDVSLVKEFALIACIWWDATNNQAILLGDERHGSTMDGDTHYNLHTNLGAQYTSGFALSGFTIGTGSVDANAQFSVDAGIFSDEDIIFSHTATSSIPIFYRLGTNWRRKTATTFPFIESGTAGFTGAAGGRPAYNRITTGSGALTEVGEGGYFLVHYACVNDRTQKIVGFLGINEYYSPFTARNSIGVELTSLRQAFPLQEFVFIGSVLFECSSVYANAPNARILNIDISPNNYTDLRPQSPKELKTAESILGILSRRQMDNSPDNFIEYISAEFVNNSISTTASAADFLSIVSGSGSSNSFSQLNNFDTVLQSSTGTSAPGSAYWRSNGLFICNNTKVYETWLEFDMQWSAVSSAAQRYTTRVGLASSALNAEPTAGIYCRYSDNINGGFIQCVCRLAGVESVLNSGTAGGTGKVRARIQIINGTDVYFYLNNIKTTGSITSSIPLNTAMFFGAGIVSSVGTTAKSLYVDYMKAYAYLYGGRA